MIRSPSPPPHRHRRPDRFPDRSNGSRPDVVCRNTPRARTVRPLALAVVLALAVLAPALAAGCGVPVDDQPRAIVRSTIATESDAERQTPTTSNSPGARQVTAYFLQDGALAPVLFPVDGGATIVDALSFATAEPPPGYNTSIPSGTAILSVEVDEQVATINLTSDINDISGPSQKQAYAQLVFTAFSFRDLDAVRFEVEGKAVDAPTDNGNLASVTVADYKGLRPEAFGGGVP